MKSNAEIIEEIKDILIDKFSPLSLYLFGSHAWGNPNENSDIDILMIVDKSDEPKAKRAAKAYRALRHTHNYPLDILIRTKKEFEDFSNIKMSLMNKISNNGKILYERQ